LTPSNSNGQANTSSSGGYTSCTFLCNLYTTDSQSDIKILQTILAKDPSIYPEQLITGTLGPKTKLAIQRFQLKYSLTTASSTAYGTVGPATRAKLEALYNATTTKTITKTPIVPTTPKPTTNTTVTPTKTPTPTPTTKVTLSRRLSLGSTGEDVKLLQTLLTKKGYSTAVTGTFDESTKQSLSKFQTDQGILPAGGSMGQITAEKLMGGR
jgi:peptidoglycan hydrolase-like protein with peptidoglycan-binding domain